MAQCYKDETENYEKSFMPIWVGVIFIIDFQLGLKL